MQNVERFLAGVGTMLATARASRMAVQAELAPDFLMLDFLRNDEYGISKILAGLLDPKGTHGQGHVFLELFLRQFWPEMVLHAPGAKVALEKLTFSGRRVDLQIDLHSAEGCLVIESKIRGARDQGGQVGDYLKYLGGRGDKHRLLYLSPVQGRLPSINSIDESSRNNAVETGSLVFLGAAELLEWVNACIAACISLRVRSFLDELRLFIKKRVIEEVDMSDANTVVECAVKNKEALQAALAVSRLIGEVKEKAFERFADIISDKMSSLKIPDGWKWHVDKRAFGKTDFDVVSIHPDSGAKFALVVNFGGKVSAEVAVGVKVLLPVTKGNVQDENWVDTEFLHKSISRNGNGLDCSKDGLVHWVWWYYLPKYRHWTTDEALVAMIDGGKEGLAHLVIGELNKALEILDEDLLARFIDKNQAQEA